MTRLFLPLIGLACAGLLSACGGRDDSTPTPPSVTSQVPPSASASVAGLISYMKALVVADTDSLEPVDVSAAMPPVDDSIEPDVVN